MKAYIVIPAYQPDLKLIELVDKLQLNDLEVIVIDDGSGEKYKDIFDELNCKVISYSQNRGKGYALKQGYKALENLNEEFVVVTCDCDGQHSVKDILRISNVARVNMDALILGKREFNNNEVPLRSRLGNTITAKVFNLVTSSHISDTQTGLRAFSSKSLLEMLEIKGDAYEYEMNVLMVLSKEKKEIIEIPIQTIYEDNNSGSHFNTVKDSMKIYFEILRFVSSSLISFVIDFLLYMLFLNFGSVLFANIGARIISATVNFNLNRKFVFKSDTDITAAALKYIALATTILITNSALLLFFTGYLGLNALLSKVIVESSLFAMNWIIQKKIIFRKDKKQCPSANFSQ